MTKDLLNNRNIVGTNRGQSLFEVVVALAIISIIIVGVVLLASASIRNSTFSRNSTQAGRYAQEATEWLRGERDKGWDTFIASINSCPLKYDNQGSPYINHCFPDGGLLWSKCDCGATDLVANIFTRQASFYCRVISQGTPTSSPVACSTAGVNDVQTNISVSWTDSQGLHQTNSVTDFTNWRAQ